MGHQRSPELGGVTETTAYRRQNQTQTSADHQTDPLSPQQSYSHPHHHPRHPQTQFTCSGPLGGQEVSGYPSYLSMASEPAFRAVQQPQQEKVKASEAVKTEGLLRSRKAVLPSEIRRRERSTEDPWRGRVEEELGMSRGLSLSQAREAKAQDPAREGQRGRTRLEERECTSHPQASQPREHDVAIYINKGDTATHTQPTAAQAGTDTGDPQVPSQRNLPHQALDAREVSEGEGFDNPESQQDSWVSVAQLKHSYMESSTTPPTRRRNEL